MVFSRHMLIAGLLLGASVAAAQWVPSNQPNPPYSGQPQPAQIPGQPQAAQDLTHEWTPISYGALAQFNPEQSGNYKFGNWVYSYDVQTSPGGGRVTKGWLSYNGKRLDNYAQANQFMRTPWGYMVYYGKTPTAEGWVRASAQQLIERNLQPIATPLASERANRLRQGLDRFQLLLMYSGTQNQQNPYPNLVLRVPQFGPGEALQGNMQQVQLTQDQANALIAHLSYDGFLDDAQDVAAAGAAQPPAGGMGLPGGVIGQPGGIAGQQPALGGQLPPIPGQPGAPAAGQTYTMQALGGTAQAPLTLEQRVPFDQQLVIRLRDINRALAADRTRPLNSLIARVQQEVKGPPTAIGSE